MKIDKTDRTSKGVGIMIDRVYFVSRYQFIDYIRRFCPNKDGPYVPSLIDY